MTPKKCALMHEIARESGRIIIGRRAETVKEIVRGRVGSGGGFAGKNDGARAVFRAKRRRRPARF
jgi:hypothetical protein